MRGRRRSREGGFEPVIELSVQSFSVGEPVGYSAPVEIATTRGAIDCRFYQAAGSTSGVIFLGDARKGFNSPGKQILYVQLSEGLLDEGVSSLHLSYRSPSNLAECTLDATAAAQFLEAQGNSAIGIVGHAFGGAVAIQAGAASDRIKTVVALATQSYGAGPAAHLAPKCSLLLIHGTADEVLPPSCSEFVHTIARQPKRLVLVKGGSHDLGEVQEEVSREISTWLRERLGAPLKGSGGFLG